MQHVVIYSGGMDSYTLLREVHEMHPKTTKALSFNYGQRHKKELQKARDVCAMLHVPHVVIELPFLGSLGASALTDMGTKVPEGHYEAESMKATVVPGRNTIMLASAMAFAETLRADPQASTSVIATVYYGAHSGDHHIYPDCRPEFIAAMRLVFERATEGRVVLEVPYEHMTKGQIASIGASMMRANRLKIPFNYYDTWTCYNGRAHPCGKCGACVERAEAMAFAGISDPLEELVKKLVTFGNFTEEEVRAQS